VTIRVVSAIAVFSDSGTVTEKLPCTYLLKKYTDMEYRHSVCNI